MGKVRFLKVNGSTPDTNGSYSLSSPYSLIGKSSSLPAICVGSSPVKGIMVQFLR